MATGNAASGASSHDGSSGPSGGNSTSHALSSEEVIQAVRFLNESVPRMQRNEKVIQQWTGVVVVSLIVLVVTVGGMVVSSIYNQTQVYGEASARSSESLNRINEELIRLENSVKNLEEKDTTRSATK